MLLSNEEEKEAQFGVKPVDKKVESAKGLSELGSAHDVVEEPEKVDLFFLYILFVLCSCKTHTCIHIYVPLHFSTTENKCLIGCKF